MTTVNQASLTPAARKFIRKAIVVTIAVASVFGFGNAGFIGGAVANSEASSVAYEYVTVEAGQTLWDLAEQVAPNQNPQDWMQDLVNLNGLTSTDLQPGQRIALP
jgi:LysM repeat protein